MFAPECGVVSEREAGVGSCTRPVPRADHASVSECGRRVE